MSVPVLSFCIATLNRGNLIGETLDSIIDQLDNVAMEQVEIVIVDGASTDNTQAVIENYQQRFKNLVYVRLPQKGGVDKDYTETVKHASGNYCWLMSDDDLIKQGAIAKVLAATEKQYDLIIVNAEVRSADFSRLIAPSLLTLKQDRVYSASENESFFADTATFMSFIGCVVIKRQCWNERAAAPYFGTEFVHIGVIFQQPLKGSILVLATPFISIRYNNASWTSRYFEIWMIKWPTLAWSFTHYSDAAKQCVVPKEPWRNPKILMINRARGSYTQKEYHKFLENRFVQAKPRLIARLITVIPGWLANLFLLAYFRFFKPNDAIAIEDLRNSSYYLPRYFTGFGKTRR